LKGNEPSLERPSLSNIQASLRGPAAIRVHQSLPVTNEPTVGSGNVTNEPTGAWGKLTNEAGREIVTNELGWLVRRVVSATNVAIVRFSHQGCTAGADVARAARLRSLQPRCDLRTIGFTRAICSENLRHLASNESSWHRTHFVPLQDGRERAIWYGLSPFKLLGCSLGVNLNRRRRDGTKGLKKRPLCATLPRCGDLIASEDGQM
jgi:hypothetical protein